MRVFGYAFMLLFVLGILACSEDTSPVVSVTHPDGWSEITIRDNAVVKAEVFHSNKVAEAGATSCKSCHGENILSAEAGTFCVDCHKDYPRASYPHPSGWTLAGPVFHGQFVKGVLNESVTTCNKCHSGENSLARPSSSCGDTGTNCHGI
ncbi:MAG: hypothetical protein AB7T22_01570 [Calditrichaceae bacterium]